LIVFRFGGGPDSYPNPNHDLGEFEEMISVQNKKNKFIYNPLKKKQTYWLDCSVMLKKYSFCEDVIPSSCIVL
jgi:hypothetical protein